MYPYNQTYNQEGERPLALHIRRLRQRYGGAPLSQAQLAALIGVSPRLLRSYESSTALPRALELVLAVALTLHVPVERLVDPALVEQLRSRIEQHTGEQRQPIGHATSRTYDE